MATAVMADLASLPGIKVACTWDRRLPAVALPAVEALLAADVEEEWAAFQLLARTCDAALVIAPEFDCQLQRRLQAVECLGARNLGSTHQAAALCADKLALAAHWRARGVPAIATQLVDWRAIEEQAFAPKFPIVVKPRFGAGSQDTHLLHEWAGLKALAAARSREPMLNQAVWQPYVPGRALSAALLIDNHAGRIEAMPVAEQRLSADGRFRYLGGRLPACGLNEAAHRSLTALALRACGVVDGLRGYVGVDMILPDGALCEPIAVEINPRLTTSYIGYRQLGGTQVAERLAWPMRIAQPIQWRGKSVSFAVAATEELIFHEA
jgi:hypothetical protein